MCERCQVHVSPRRAKLIHLFTPSTLSTPSSNKRILVPSASSTNSIHITQLRFYKDINFICCTERRLKRTIILLFFDIHLEIFPFSVIYGLAPYVAWRVRAKDSCNFTVCIWRLRLILIQRMDEADICFCIIRKYIAMEFLGCVPGGKRTHFERMRPLRLYISCME